MQGDYKLRVQVTSDRVDLLEKRKDMALTLSRVASDIKVDCYATFNDAGAVSGAIALCACVRPHISAMSGCACGEGLLFDGV